MRSPLLWAATLCVLFAATAVAQDKPIFVLALPIVRHAATASATAPISTIVPPASRTPTSTATVTATPFPMVTPVLPTLTIDQDDNEPVVGQDFALAGSVYDGNGDGISGVQVTVTYRYEGIGKNAWCTAITSGSDGDWKCTVKVPADFQSKAVTWTGTIIVNGQVVQEAYEYDFGESTLSLTMSFDSAAQSLSESVGQVIIPIRLSAATSQNINVPYTVNSTAANPADHNLANGTINFPAGSTSANLMFDILQDTVDEANESVIITLGGSMGVSLGTPSVHTVTIVNDDPSPTVQFSAASYTIAEGDTTATITTTLSASSGRVVTIHYASKDGAATAGSDYGAVSGTLTFQPGMTVRMFTIPIMDNTIYENNETVNLSLSNPINATLGPQADAILTIYDDEVAT